MKRYVMKMAEIFDGLRLDNTHSTELWVGEYMMRKARKVKNNLIIFAELFTGDPTIDIIYTNIIYLLYF
jgi:glycogen debranching enzyme